MTTPLAGSIEGRIAEELGVRERQVRAAVELLDGGSTVPFIARYRKEATEMLDDAQLRTVAERLRYLRELEERRTEGRAQYNTVAGLVVTELGRIPQSGDGFSAYGLRFEVVDMDGRRVDKVLVQADDPPASNLDMD